MTGNELIWLGIRAQLRELDDAEWRAFEREVRLPKPDSAKAHAVSRESR
jgi:hypothetical protein